MKKALWLDDRGTPDWVKEKLPELEGVVELA